MSKTSRSFVDGALALGAAESCPSEGFIREDTVAGLGSAFVDLILEI
jgi:hypothetical protein